MESKERLPRQHGGVRGAQPPVGAPIRVSVDTAVSSHRRRRRTTARGAQQRRRASWARSKRLEGSPAGHRTSRQDRWGVADGQRFPRPSPDSTWPGVGRGSDETPRWRRFLCWTGDKQPLHTKMYCYCTINREFLCTSEHPSPIVRRNYK